MHGLLNIHIQFNNYSLDGIKFTIVFEFSSSEDVNV